MAYLELSSEGILKLMYSKHGENWNLIWESPQNPCDIYGTCGPFGVCEPSESSTIPTCKCLKGFVPKSLDEWGRGNRTRGCVRQTSEKSDVYSFQVVVLEIISGWKNTSFYDHEKSYPSYLMYVQTLNLNVTLRFHDESLSLI